MGAFKLHTLKQKLWAIVIASFAARVIMFFALPNTPSFLAPDEGTYAALVKWIGESKLASQFPAFGEGLYLSGRTIIVPASLLYRAGLNELEAVRLVSTTYGFCALLLVVFVTIKIYDQYRSNVTYQVRNENLIFVIISIFAFLPSHFVWSNLGLRESATEFWLITAFVTFYCIFHYQKEIRILSLLVFVGAIVCTFSARPQVGWVLGVTFIVYLLFNIKQRNTYFMLPIVLCGVVLGSTLNLVDTSESTFKPLLLAGEIVEHKQSMNQLGAASVIETQSCPFDNQNQMGSSPNKFETYFCIMWRSPYMTSTFLFRPILGVDGTSTSSFFAALENIIWFTLFVLILWFLIKRPVVSLVSPLSPAVVFLFLYVFGASAYQGNMGTGFRHKSLILWAVLLVLFALFWRKPHKPEETPRNDSQENAV